MDLMDFISKSEFSTVKQETTNQQPNQEFDFDNFNSSNQAQKQKTADEFFAQETK